MHLEASVDEASLFKSAASQQHSQGNMRKKLFGAGRHSVEPSAGPDLGGKSWRGSLPPVEARRGPRGKGSPHPFWPLPTSPGLSRTPSGQNAVREWCCTASFLETCVRRMRCRAAL